MNLTLPQSFNEYTLRAVTTAKWFPSILEDLEHAALGIDTETGEFNSEVKRVAIYGKALDEPKRLHMIEETGDSMWYVGLGCHVIGRTVSWPAPSILAQTDLREWTLKRVAFDFAKISGNVVASVDRLRSSSCPQHVVYDDLHVHFTQLVHRAAIASRLLGTTLQQVCLENNIKLMDKDKGRYGAAGYSDTAAEARKDKGGLDARVS